MTGTLISTDWRVRKLAPGIFEVSTDVLCPDETRSEQVTIRVVVNAADTLSGVQVHRAALERARKIIDACLKPDTPDRSPNG